MGGLWRPAWSLWALVRVRSSAWHSARMPGPAWALGGSGSWCRASSPSRARPQGCQSRCPGLSCRLPQGCSRLAPRPCPPAHTLTRLLSPAVHVQHESQIPRHEPAAPRLQRQRPLDAGSHAHVPTALLLPQASARTPGRPLFLQGPCRWRRGSSELTLTAGSMPGHGALCGRQGPAAPSPPPPKDSSAEPAPGRRQPLGLGPCGPAPPAQPPRPDAWSLAASAQRLLLCVSPSFSPTAGPSRPSLSLCATLSASTSLALSLSSCRPRTAGRQPGCSPRCQTPPQAWHLFRFICTNYSPHL